MARQQGSFGCLLALAIGYSMIYQSYSERTKEEKEQMMQGIQSCKASENAEQTEIDAMMKDRTLPTSHEGKCFMKCVAEKMDAGLGPNGEIDYISSEGWLEENVEDQATREKMKAITKECKDAELSDGDPCETAARNIECLMKKFEAAGIKERMGMS